MCGCFSERIQEALEQAVKFHMRHAVTVGMIRSIFLEVAAASYNLPIPRLNDFPAQRAYESRGRSMSAPGFGFLGNNEVFLGKYVDEPDPRCSSSGNGYSGLEDRIWHLNALNAILHDPARPADEKLLWFELIAAKRLADLELPTGTLVPTPYGPYQVDRVIHASGAFVLCLHCLPPSPEASPAPSELPTPLVLVFRGTRLVPSATSPLSTAFNDLESHMGASGVLATTPALLAWLSLPHHLPHKVHLIGMSLGGVHAQRFAPALHPSRLYALTTVGSPGIDCHTAHHWARSLSLPSPHLSPHLRAQPPAPEDHPARPGERTRYVHDDASADIATLRHDACGDTASPKPTFRHPDPHPHPAHNTTPCLVSHICAPAPASSLHGASSGASHERTSWGDASSRHVTHHDHPHPLSPSSATSRSASASACSAGSDTCMLANTSPRPYQHRHARTDWGASLQLDPPLLALDSACADIAVEPDAGRGLPTYEGVGAVAEHGGGGARKTAEVAWVPHVRVIRDVEDCTPIIGGSCHLGLGAAPHLARVRVIYLRPCASSSPSLPIASTGAPDARPRWKAPPTQPHTSPPPATSTGDAASAGLLGDATDLVALLDDPLSHLSDSDADLPGTDREVAGDGPAPAMTMTATSNALPAASILAQPAAALASTPASHHPASAPVCSRSTVAASLSESESESEGRSRREDDAEFCVAAGSRVDAAVEPSTDVLSCLSCLEGIERGSAYTGLALLMRSLATVHVRLPTDGLYTALAIDNATDPARCQKHLSHDEMAWGHTESLRAAVSRLYHLVVAPSHLSHLYLPHHHHDHDHLLHPPPHAHPHPQPPHAA